MIQLNFCSDNATGASPEIMEAVVRANEGHAMPYGDDSLTVQAEDKVRDLFETDADVFLVATGSASNALALSVMTPPYGAIFRHPAAHIDGFIANANKYAG